jgi:hypothetical protein
VDFEPLAAEASAAEYACAPTQKIDNLVSLP